MSSRPNFIRPLLPAAGWRVTSPFGTRVHPVTHRTTKHSGIDLAAPYGSPVIAPADGVVACLWIDRDFGGGLSMVIRAQGYSFGFAHLSEALVREGDLVRAGDTVARSGGIPGTMEAGRSTGPHLHLTVRHEGKLIDPTEVFGGK